MKVSLGRRRWRHLGVVHCPSGGRSYARSHASGPTPIVLGDVVRVYFQTRDERGIGRISFVDLLASDPSRVVRVADGPVLDVGAPGSFDENGVFPCAVLPMPGLGLGMFYVGFELGAKVPYRLLTGLAVSSDGGESFERVRRTPVFERGDAELLFRCGTWVLARGRGYQAWYVAGSSFDTVGERRVPRYEIRTAHSLDGIAWPDHGAPVLERSTDDELGFGRPYVVPRESGWDLYYSVRSRARHGGYRLGLAFSADGETWERADAALGFEPSGDAWDSETQCYAAALHTDRGKFLFYNGNDYGRAGFGALELLEDSSHG